MLIDTELNYSPIRRTIAVTLNSRTSNDVQDMWHDLIATSLERERSREFARFKSIPHIAVE